jgi:hypothetical protein
MLGAMSAERLGPGKNYIVAQGVPATFVETPSRAGGVTRTFLDAGHNPLDGVIVTYHLRERPESGPALTFFDADGREIRRFSANDAEGPKVPAEPGMNRFVWDMRYPGAREAPGDEDAGLMAGPVLEGPLVIPGLYSVKLDVAGETHTRPVEVREDPRTQASDDDLAAQLALLIKIRDRLSETHDAINELRSVRRQVGEWLSRGKGRPGEEALAATGGRIAEKLNAAENRLISTWATSERGQMGTPLPRLVHALTTLASVVASADAVPTHNSYEVFDHLSARIAEQVETVRRVVDRDVAAFTDLIEELDIPAIAPTVRA